LKPIPGEVVKGVGVEGFEMAGNVNVLDYSKVTQV